MRVGQDGPAFAMGLVYVVEGSGHGNGQLLSHLRKQEEFQDLGAEAFLVRSQAGIRSRWPETMALMDRFGGEDHEALVRGAVEGFRLFRDLWLSTESGA